MEFSLYAFVFVVLGPFLKDLTELYISFDIIVFPFWWISGIREPYPDDMISIREIRFLFILIVNDVMFSVYVAFVFIQFL